jgi:hypothetical protein
MIAANSDLINVYLLPEAIEFLRQLAKTVPNTSQ